MKKLIYLFLALIIVACSGEDGGNDGDNNGDNNDNQTTDTTAPIINIVGEAVIDVLRGSTYIDEGATAIDDVDGDITSLINSNVFDVNTLVSGEYIIIYEVYDSAGNYSSATRTVNVIDNGHPIVGDLINGGIVFWVNPDDNTHGLVADIFYPPRYTWINLDCEGPYCGPYRISGNNYIGGGAENTDYIIYINEDSNIGGSNYAAFYARNLNRGGFNDWYLPNEAELDEFTENLNIIDNALNNCECASALQLRIYDGDFIWTSNGIISGSDNTAIAVQLDRVWSAEKSKYAELYVLPVRAY